MSRRAGAIPEDTRAALLASATEEFAEYGFEKASLRRICTKAGVTTGALYFLFQDKEDLFRSVISPVTDRILVLIAEHYETELASPLQSVLQGEDEDVRAGHEVLSLFYAHRTVCDVVLSNRSHPAVCAFFDSLIEKMDRQMVLLLTQAHPAVAQHPAFNQWTIHWISHMLIDSVLHIIKHNFEEEQAKQQLQILVRFLRGGFLALLP